MDIDLNLSDDKLLKYAISQGIINLVDVRNDMKEKEKQRLLSKHKYKIFQDKDGRWKTTLPDVNKTGRRLIAKTTKEKIEKVIIEYYATEEDKKIVKDLQTLREIYPVWLQYKSVKTDSGSYIRRLQNDWNRFYENDDIVDVPIKDLSYIILDKWIHQTIKRNSLNKKQYYNMSTIIRQVLDYCVEEGYVDDNIFKRVKVNNKMFTKQHKPKSTEQVFSENEEELLFKEAMKKFESKPRFITPLAIVLNFQLGLRVGELLALKWSDIEENYICIQRMEVSKYYLDKNNEVIRDGFEVVDHVKSSAGFRELYLNSRAKEILKLIKDTNDAYDYYNDGYIFISCYGKRLTSGSFNDYLYNLCRDVNIKPKSSHKIRKTYISSLFDVGLNINKIRELAGHEDERTSLNNYCFDRKNDIDTELILENLHSQQKCKQV